MRRPLHGVAEKLSEVAGIGAVSRKDGGEVQNVPCSERPACETRHLSSAAAEEGLRVGFGFQLAFRTSSISLRKGKIVGPYIERGVIQELLVGGIRAAAVGKPHVRGGQKVVQYRTVLGIVGEPLSCDKASATSTIV